MPEVTRRSHGLHMVGQDGVRHLGTSGPPAAEVEANDGEIEPRNGTFRAMNRQPRGESREIDPKNGAKKRRRKRRTKIETVIATVASRLRRENVADRLVLRPPPSIHRALASRLRLERRPPPWRRI